MRSGLARATTAVAGVLLLVYVIHRTGAHQITADIARLGWGLAWVIALGGVAHLVKTWAWRFTLLDHHDTVSFRRLSAWPARPLSC